MRLACVQQDVQFGNFGANASRIHDRLVQLGAKQVDLAVFPECALGGYCVESEEEARHVALPSPSSPVGREHPIWRTIQAAVDESAVVTIIGFAEVEAETNLLFNSAALLAPNRPAEQYRKSHLPCMGFDMFASLGRELPVFDLPFGKVGILICFDQRPPESARTLALKGADLIVLPTNWPEGAETTAGHYGFVRSSENKVFYASCNRVGVERGFRFIGLSKIIDPFGKAIVEAGPDEDVLIADIDLSIARDKRNVLIPGKYELDILGCRQPTLYAPITAHESS